MKYFFYLFLGMSLLSGCMKKEQDPVWIELEEWTLVANDAATDDSGQLTQHFSDAWVYVDNKLIGCFELPCKIPVRAAGENIRIQIYPAIRTNGIAATKMIYPFVEPVELFTSMHPGETIIPEMTTRYFENVQFAIHDFDGNGTTLAESSDLISTANLSYVNDPLIGFSPDNTFAQVTFSGNQSLFEAKSDLDFTLPPVGNKLFLEIDYRNTLGLLTGVALFDGASFSIHPNILLNSQSAADVRWKKIYIDLSELRNNFPNTEDLQIYFKAELPADQAAATIIIDNIKIVSLP